MCIEAFWKSGQAQADARRQIYLDCKHKADRLVTGALKLLLLAVCDCRRPWSVHKNSESRLQLDQHRQIALHWGPP